MNSLPSTLKKISLSASLALLLSLSSCSLPPREAWNKIQTEGLLAYLRDTQSPARTGYASAATRLEPPAPPAPVFEPTAPSKPTVVENTPEPVRISTKPVVTTVIPRTPDIIGPPAVTQTTPPAVIKSSNDKLLVAQTVPALPGFVRSPYTSPPRLVDVKGAVAGATMICPYTQRPFLIPNDFVNATSSSALVINQVPIKEPLTPVTPVNPPVKRDPVLAEKKELPVKSTPASSIFGSAPTIGNNTPVVTAASQPQTVPQIKPATQENIPLGLVIPGRPGFVHSPYAAKNQLVDVTGLPAGMEVKCPYTGKIFRVPGPNINVQNGAILAAPEKLEKK